jgi:lactoylglutathione lyase
VPYFAGDHYERRHTMTFGKIGAIVLFVDDLEGCTKFYRDTLGFQTTFSDDASIGFKVGDQDFLLLRASSAIEMISAEAVAKRAAGGSEMFCVGFDDVDAAYRELSDKGVTFIKPPKDQAWGRRTTYFVDPEGNIWELYQELGG